MSDQTIIDVAALVVGGVCFIAFMWFVSKMFDD